MKQTPLVSLLLLVVSCSLAKAEVPLMSPDELKSESSHIVIGKVRAVYSTTEKSKNWEDTSSIAEISVMSVEKGTGLQCRRRGLRSLLEQKVDRRRRSRATFKRSQRRL